MKRIHFATASLALLLGAATAHAQLEIRDVQAAHGRLGTTRQSLEYCQGDEVFVRFLVHGAQTNQAGEADLLMALVVTDAHGNKVVDNESRVNATLALGGGTFPGEARVDLAPGIEPGEYTLSVRVKDRVSKETTSFERRFTCKAPEFAIARVRFFHDAEGHAPASFGGVLGQTLYFRNQAIGFDRSKGEIDLVMAFRLFDENGKEVTRTPIEASLRTDDEAALKNATHVDFAGQLALNRVGNFTLRISITDRVANKTTRFEAPFRVIAP
jgi:hypothetical protein